MDSFWHWYIWIIAVGSIAALFWIIQISRTVEELEHEDDTMDHAFDGIEEYNKPLPAWWLYLFWGTMLYGLGYYAYFGLGNWNGLSGWSSHKQLMEETAAHEAKYGEIFAKYAAMDLDSLVENKEALAMGRRMFENNCALCHGKTSEGSYGFPNLVDNDWLYGGTAEAIKSSVANGRRGQMPAWGDALGDNGVDAVANYVLKLAGEKHNSTRAGQGEALYMASCAACHGNDGAGNQQLGAPNLTDKIWLYDNPNESLIADIRHSIKFGRAGNMPAWQEILGEEKVHIISAYVYSKAK